ncbi:MAG: proline dehydrogenase family protein [Acidobacteriota bacterium]
MLRNWMLKFADSPRLVGYLSRTGMKTGFARRFVAGETPEEALQAVRELNKQGLKATLDLLGEGVRDEAEAARAAQEYVQLLHLIRDSGVDSGISIKLTQLGLDIGREVCARHLRTILDCAREVGNFVRIDMEGSAYTEDTVELFIEHFKTYGRKHVGIVIQSYLYRSQKDIERLSRLGCSVRLCKGAYKEPPQAAFPKKSEVDDSFIGLLETLLSSDCYTAIATHDDRMVEHARRYIADQQVSDSNYEFQMLYGTRREYQLRIRRQGYQMRIYVPFGTQWAPYFIRRLAERPANMLFVLKNLLKK